MHDPLHPRSRRASARPADRRQAARDEYGAGPRGLVALEIARRPAYTFGMNINLPREQELWLQAQVANGEFASVEDAVRCLIADRMALDAHNLAWATPYVDDARAAVARGEYGSPEEAIADIDAHLASLKR